MLEEVENLLRVTQLANGRGVIYNRPICSRNLTLTPLNFSQHGLYVTHSLNDNALHELNNIKVKVCKVPERRKENQVRVGKIWRETTHEKQRSK